MSDDSLKKHGSGQHEGSASTSPYPMSRLAPPHTLVDVAKQIQEADAMLGAVVGNKLKVIADQVRHLQDQARAILEAARRDSELHRASCHFIKRPGHLYHLYRRANDARYFSMVSPEEWGGSPPDAFEGSYRLEYDLSWTPAGQLETRDRADIAIRKLLTAGAGPFDADR